MKAKISEGGYLLIERAGRYPFVDCPLSPTTPANCGDWCSLFGEPEYNHKNKLLYSIDCIDQEFVLQITDMSGSCTRTSHKTIEEAEEKLAAHPYMSRVGTSCKLSLCHKVLDLESLEDLRTKKE